MPTDPRSNLARLSCARPPGARFGGIGGATPWAVPCLLLLLTSAGGCQFGPGVERHQLIQHQALIDFSGLKPPEAVDVVRMEAQPPASWMLHGVERHALYNHQQWKSPTARTGVGVIYARLPLPLSADTLLWFGKQQYAKQGMSARDLGNWTDAVGRKWFEVETDKYHARGYAIADGLDAWIVYMGYKVDVAPEPADISLAARCVEMFVPVKTGERFAVPPSVQKVTPVSDAPAPTTRPTSTTRPAEVPVATGATVGATNSALTTRPTTVVGDGTKSKVDHGANAVSAFQILSQKWSGRSVPSPATAIPAR